MMKYIKTVILTIAISIMFTYASFAINTQVLSGEEGKAQAVSNVDNKLMLKQNWYGMSFELNPLQNISNTQLKSVDEKIVITALEEMNYAQEASVIANVYIIDYKLKDYSNCLALSFKDNSIVIFGTYYAFSEEKLHKLAVHEFGHQVDFQLMNEEKWEQYRKIRNIQNTVIYNNNSQIYQNRPQEIFAEDFRLLFGGESAKKNPHLNTYLENPTKVKGLREFFLSIAK